MKNKIKKILMGVIIMLVSMPIYSGGFFSNNNFCLSVDSSTANTVGDMAFMENSCYKNLKVKYCFGSYKCETRTGVVTVPANDKRTIFYDKDKYNSMSLIAFACDENVEFQDCHDAYNEFFEYK